MRHLPPGITKAQKERIAKNEKKLRILMRPTRDKKLKALKRTARQRKKEQR